jgi:molecular chaperone GrpE
MTASDQHEAPPYDETVAPATDPDETPAAADPLAKAQAEIAQLKDAWLRARAETENVRRQGQADVARAHKYAIETFAKDLLPVRDALETGAELTLKSLDAAFSRAQISEIDPAGQKFDPHRHEAMQVVPSNQPPNTVVTVFQKGYLINDRVLRPALVTVSKAPDAG